MSATAPEQAHELFVEYFNAADNQPAPLQHLRKLCGMRTAVVCSALAELSALGEVTRDSRGYQIKRPFPVSRPIDPGLEDAAPLAPESSATALENVQTPGTGWKPAPR